MIQKLKQVYKVYASLEGSLFRYALSYCVLLALLPTLVVVVILFQNSILDVNILTQLLYNYIPAEIVEPLLLYILEKEIAIYKVGFLLLPTTYLASRSFYSFLLISATHEKFKTRPLFLKVKGWILFIYFLFDILCMYICLHISFLPKILIFLFYLFVSLYLFYRVLSFEKKAMAFGCIGALFSSISIVLCGMLFFYIVENYTSYANVYGPLGSFVILLLSIYVISSIIYFGYCLNLTQFK